MSLKGNRSEMDSNRPTKLGDSADPCADLAEAIMDFVGNQCDESRRVRLQRHLDDCPECLEALGVEQQIRELVRKRCCYEAPQELRASIVRRLRVTYIEVRGD